MDIIMLDRRVRTTSPVLRTIAPLTNFGPWALSVTIFLVGVIADTAQGEPPERGIVLTIVFGIFLAFGVMNLRLSRKFIDTVYDVDRSATVVAVSVATSTLAFFLMCTLPELVRFGMWVNS